MDFSIMFFSGSARDSESNGRYEQIHQAARIADQNGLKRIWLPERHFVQFGALHPNPSLLAANLAGMTKDIRLAAGSIVAPLHDPIRIAEEWSVVDNLSGGRVDVALASGWLRSDFVLASDRYATRQIEYRKRVRQVRELWSGASLTRQVEGRSYSVAIRPVPVQPSLPLWITAARSIETFQYAGSVGANVLTYLVDLGFEGLEAAIAAYRKARADNGFEPDEGVVTVMVHCSLGNDSAEVRRAVADRYRKYLFDNRELMLQLDRPADAIDDKTFAEIADIQFGRVFENLSLIGSFDAAHKTLDRLSAIGIGEVACLIDFVDDDAMTLNAVKDIATLQQSYRDPDTAGGTGDVLIADRNQFYNYIGTLGGFYGDEFRLVEKVRLDGDHAETELLVEDTSEQGKAILVDAIISTAHAFALQSGLRAASVPLAMPAGVGSMSIGEVEPGVLTVVTQAKGRIGDIDYFDAVARDSKGRMVVELGRIAFNRLKLSPSDPRVIAASGAVRKIEWNEVSVGVDNPGSISVVIHTSKGSDGSGWISLFRDAGCDARANSDELKQLPDTVGEWHIFVAQSSGETSGDLKQAQDMVVDIANWINALPNQGRGIKWAVLTNSAQRVLESDMLSNSVSASAWAAAASLTQLGGGSPQGTIDIDIMDASTVRAIVAILASENLPAAIREGNVFQMELKPFGKNTDTTKPVREMLAGCRAVVLGGHGALGSQLVSWLEEEGAESVTCLSRSGARGGRHGIPRAAIQDCRADISAEAIEDVLRDAGQDPTDFDFVFHLAGVDTPDTDGITQDAVASVFGPKLGGIENLHRMLENSNRPMHVVLFSSLAALRGSQGQVAYSAANSSAAAALKKMIHGTPHRATIIHFGPWAGDGMAAAPQLDAVFKFKGIERISPEVALRALGLMLAGGHEESVIAQFPEACDNTAVEEANEAKTKREIEKSGALSSLQGMTWDECRAALVSRLQVLIAEALETEIGEVDAETNLYDLGFDSLMAVELRNQLSEEYAIEVGLVVLMDAQTIGSVADKLMPIVQRALEQGPQAEREIVTEELEVL